MLWPPAPACVGEQRRAGGRLATRLAEFIPFLDFDVEIRRILSTTNAVESLNARYRRRAVKACGHFPAEQARWIASTWLPDF